MKHYSIFIISSYFMFFCNLFSVAQENKLPPSFSFNNTKEEKNLSFLDSIAENKRIIWLGESDHRIEDFNELKIDIIKYLHEKHGYNVVVFESGFATCNLTNLVKKNMSSIDVLSHSLIGVWRCNSLCDFMQYVKDHNVQLAGMDPNNSALPLNAALYSEIINNKTIAAELAETDSMALIAYEFKSDAFYNDKKHYNDKDTSELFNTKQLLIAKYDKIKNELIASSANSVLVKTIDAKLYNLKNTNFDRKNEKMFYITYARRDSLMAMNLEYIADTLYPNEKIIVWAHNAHISKIPYDGPFSIPRFLNTKFYTESYIIGLYAGNGTYTWGYKNIKPAKIHIPKNSLENTYKSKNKKYIYYDAKVFQNIILPHNINGEYNFKSDISKLYDGIIIVNDVISSRLIRK